LYNLIVQLLLDHKDIDVNQQNKFGTTALNWASDKGHTEIVKLLLERKLTLRATGLILASYEGKKEIVQLFLEHKGVNLNRVKLFKNFTEM
jgi:ankyrin repeat protein